MNEQQQTKQIEKYNPATLSSYLEKAATQIKRALPKYMTPERVIRTAITAVGYNTDLQECSLVSILGCVIQASELALELTGPLGQAYMVPYKVHGKPTAQLQIGYRGLINLAYRSGQVASIGAHVVHEKDAFLHAQGTSPFIKHIPCMDGKPGEVIAVYAVMFLKHGGHLSEVMTTEEINEHRDRFAKGLKRADSPWSTNWNQMAMKTPVRRVCKYAPVSVQMQTAIQLDEYAEAGVLQTPSPLMLDHFPAKEENSLPGPGKHSTGKDGTNGDGSKPKAETPKQEPKGEAPPDNQDADVPEELPGANKAEVVDNLVQKIKTTTSPEELARIKADIETRRGYFGETAAQDLIGLIHERAPSLGRSKKERATF